MNEKSGIKEVFQKRNDRVVTAMRLFTIYDKDKLIGFANIVREKQNNNFYFLDVVITEEYRGKHIASQVLEMLKKAKQHFYLNK